MIHIMGIVNLTPDSFYSGSRTAACDFMPKVRQMLSDGADIIDIGACSTRPGAPQPSLEEEWARLEPALRDIAGSTITGACPPPDKYRGRGPLTEGTDGSLLPIRHLWQWEGPEGAKRPESPAPCTAGSRRET